MRDERKTKKQLIAELEILRQHVAELGSVETVKTLGESEEAIRALVETSRDWIWAIDAKGTHTYCNPAIEHILGYRPDELLGRSSLEFMQEEDRAAIEAQFPGWIAGKQGWSNQLLRWRHKDGSYRYLESNAVPILGVDGELLGFRGVDRDVTDRLRAEQGLRESEEKFSKAFDSSLDAVTLSRLETGEFVESNRGFERISGYTREEAVGRTAVELGIWPGAEDREQMVALLTESGVIREMDVEFHTKSGESRSCLLSAEVVDIQSQRYMLSVTRDITEQKKAAAALRDSEERFSKAFHTSPDPIVMTSLTDGRITEINQGFERVSGYTRDEVIGKTSVQIGLWKNADDRAEVMGILASEGEVRFWEGQFLTKSGEELTCELSMLPMEVGEQPWGITVFRDITDRKRAEEALRQSEARLSNILRTAPVGIGTARDRVIIDGNDQFSEMLGYSIEELSGQSTRLVFPSEEEFQRFGSEAYPKLAAGETATTEARFRRKDGSEIDVLVSLALLDERDPDGEVTITALDITERKQARRAIEESEARFRAVFDQAVELMAILDPDGTLIMVNAAGRELLPSGRDVGVGQPFWRWRSFRGLAQEQDRAREAVLHAAEGEVVSLEMKNVDRDGAPIVIEAIFSPLRDEGGRIVYIVGTGHDITERQRLEQEILEISSRERQRIGQDLHDGLGQQLTGLGFSARALERKLEDKGLAESGDARAFQQQLTAALRETRFLARGLLPVAFDAAGLPAALEDLAVNASTLFRMECRAFVDSSIEVDSEETAAHMYQVAREAVTNAARHGQASHVDIELLQADDGITLSVVDDGVGFPVDGPSGEGLGLRIMRYRTRLIGATLEISPGSSRGTIVRCLLPDTTTSTAANDAH